MKKLIYIATFVITTLISGVTAFADDPSLADVLDKDKNVFEFHLSLPQFIIIAIFIFCAVMLLYFNFKPMGGTASSAVKKTGGKHIDETPVISDIIKSDPLFQPREFREYVGRVYSELREAICAKSLGDIRPYVSDDVISQIQKNVDYYVSRGQTKHYEKSNIYSVRIAKVSEDDGMQTITVRVHVSFIEYVTNDENDKIVSGSLVDRVSRFYKLRFCRLSGMTSDIAYKRVTDVCPYCGAPIPGDSGVICAYCHSKLNIGKYGFLLTSYERWKKTNNESADSKEGKRV